MLKITGIRFDKRTGLPVLRGEYKRVGPRIDVTSIKSKEDILKIIERERQKYRDVYER